MRLFVLRILIVVVSGFSLLAGGCSQKVTEVGKTAYLDKIEISSRAEGAAMNQREVQPMKRVKMVFDGGEAIVELHDNPTSRDFQSMLPITLHFKDYSGTEKLLIHRALFQFKERRPVSILPWAT